MGCHHISSSTHAQYSPTFLRLLKTLGRVLRRGKNMLDANCQRGSHFTVSQLEFNRIFSKVQELRVSQGKKPHRLSVRSTFPHTLLMLLLLLMLRMHIAHTFALLPLHHNFQIIFFACNLCEPTCGLLTLPNFRREKMKFLLDKYKFSESTEPHTVRMARIRRRQINLDANTIASQIIIIIYQKTS